MGLRVLGVLRRRWGRNGLKNLDRWRFLGDR
jgi:hypothetical protein